MGENDPFTVRGHPMILMYSDEPSGISREEEKRMRRVLKENKIFGHLPRTTPKWPSISIDVRAMTAAYYRRSAGCKPPIVHTLNPRVIIRDAGTAPKVEGSRLKLLREELGLSTESLVNHTNPAAEPFVATGSKAEVEVGSVSKCPAADPSATVIGGSVLKRPRVDLGEASQILAGNLNPGQDISATGTIEEVKGGSVLNKDLGESSELVVNNLNSGADPFVDASGNT